MKRFVLLAVVIVSALCVCAIDMARAAGDDAPTLEFFLAETAPIPGLKPAKIEGGNEETIYLRLKPVVGQSDIAAAQAVTDNNDRPAIEVTFTEAGEKKMARATGENLSKRLAIVMNGKVLSAPVIRSKIGKKAQISGAFSEAEVRRLVASLQPAKEK